MDKHLLGVILVPTHIRINESLPRFGIETPTPTAVYRYINDDEYAERMLDGYLYIPTLQMSRDREDEERGDKYEGYKRYYVESASGSLDSPKVRYAAEQLGVSFGDSSAGNVSFAWCSSNKRFSDAYILCTSRVLTPHMFESFGKHCIEIVNIPLFYEIVSEILERDYDVYHGIAAKTIYNDRWYSGEELPPKAHVELLKPANYKHQREYRFAWNTRGKGTLKPLTIYSEKFKQLFKRIK